MNIEQLLQENKDVSIQFGRCYEIFFQTDGYEVYYRKSPNSLGVLQNTYESVEEAIAYVLRQL